ncbi:MAG: radical SAM protein [archaeon]|jgi:hydroxymethylglutaryl-CoA reductase
MESLNLIPNVDLEITNVCNSNCPGCWGPPKEIACRPLDEFKQMLLNLKTFGLQNIALSGGEPTLVPGIEDFIKYVNLELSLDIFLQTNGINLIKLLPKIAPHLHTISISLESSTPENDFRRHEKGFNTAIRCIKHVLKKYPKIKLKIGTCVFKQNIEDLENIGNLLLKLGFEKRFKQKSTWKLYQITRFGKGKNDPLLDSMILDNITFKKKMKQLKKIFAGKINLVSIASDEMGAYCIVIRPNGEVAVNSNSKKGEEQIIHKSILKDFNGAVKSILLAQNKKHIIERLEQTYFVKVEESNNKFSTLPPAKRLDLTSSNKQIKKSEFRFLKNQPQKSMLKQMDLLAENVVSVFPMPYSFARNFTINKKDILIPYVCPESGVVAAASFAAKLCKPTGGFKASADKQVMIGQIVFSDIPNSRDFENKINDNKAEIFEWIGTKSKLMKKNVKPLNIISQIVPTKSGDCISLLIEFDVGDITGPRTIGEICSEVAPKIQKFAPESKIILALHSDFLQKRLARATAKWKAKDLKFKNLTGDEVMNRILQLYEFSKVDVNRAVTSNKGVLNGIVAFALATGNDTPMIEANIHSYASRSGTYQPLANFFINNKNELVGEIELPIAIGFKGGSTLHPFSQVTKEIVQAKSAKDYAKIAASIGLAQNFAAMRAIVTHGMVIGNKKLERKFYGQTLCIPRTISTTTPRAL